MGHSTVAHQPTGHQRHTCQLIPSRSTLTSCGSPIKCNDAVASLRTVTSCRSLCASTAQPGTDASACSIRTLRITACAKLSHEARLSTGALTVDAMDNSDASDAGHTPNMDGAIDICNAKGCDLPATATCDRCERRFCAAHCAVLVLQRRDESSGRQDHHGMLARLPMHTESYTLCATCRNKPVPRNLPPLTMTPPLTTPQSTPKRGFPGAHDQAVTNRWSEAWSVDDE